MVRALVSRYDAVEMGLRKGDIDDGLMEREDGDKGSIVPTKSPLGESRINVFFEV
jgi:hypothetical protein